METVFGEEIQVHPQVARQLLGRLGRERQVLERLAPRYHLDAVQVGPVLAVGRDLERPDLGRPTHVGSAAQLAGEPVHFDHSDEVAVLLAEEHDGAEFAGLLERRVVVPHRLVLGYLLQAELLHAPELLLVNLARVTVVEPQPVRPDVAPSLHNVLAKNRPESPVQDVRRGVVGLDLLPSHPVYRGGHRVASHEGAPLHAVPAARCSHRRARNPPPRADRGPT